MYNSQENETTKEELEEMLGIMAQNIKRVEKVQHLIVMGVLNCNQFNDFINSIII